MLKTKAKTLGRPPKSKTGTASKRVQLRITPSRHKHYLEHGGPNLTGWLTSVADRASDYRESP